MTRGYAVVALHDPKNPANVGGAMRAVSCYAADMVVLGGARPASWMRHATDTIKAWRHVPVVMSVDVMAALPYGCEAVAVDLVDGAGSLVEFHHPERAMCVFGPEDGTLGGDLLSRCSRRVMVPTVGCMNLAATVNVVLYDRLAKRTRVTLPKDFVETP